MNSSHYRRGGGALERVRFFPRQLLTADDMLAEQEYGIEKLRRHNRHLHGWGVVCGCEVLPPAADDQPWQVRVCPGYLVTPCGDEIRISEPVPFDLARDLRRSADPCAAAWPCPPVSRVATGDQRTVYLTACFVDCHTRPVRVAQAGCGCDEQACEYSRLRDSFELRRLDELPGSHAQALLEAEAWRKKRAAWKGPGQPALDCPAEPADNCVLLATLRLPANQTERIVASGISYADRRILAGIATWYG
jgi:hypothetical protein